MIFVVFLLGCLGAQRALSSSDLCPSNSECTTVGSCHYQDVLSDPVWCDDRKSKICCPRSNGDTYEGNRYTGPVRGPIGANPYDGDSYGYEGESKSYPYQATNPYGANNVLGNFRHQECGVRRSPHKKISTGHSAERETSNYAEFPWQVAIFARVNYESDRRTFKFQCGGTLISPLLVVTAAHCVKGIRMDNLRLRLGEWNLGGSHGELYPVVNRNARRVLIHEYYKQSTFAHDISLLVMHSPVDLRRTPHISPVCLPPKHTRFSEHSKCFIAGWGRDVFKGNYRSNLLKYASVSLLKDDCRHRLKEAIPALTNNFFNDDLRCITGTLGRNACIGDGGGAVVCPLSNEEESVCDDYECKHEHYFVAGVISWGSDDCGAENSVTVVTDFLSHRDWILQKARDYDRTFGPRGYDHHESGYGDSNIGYDQYDDYDRKY